MRLAIAEAELHGLLREPARVAILHALGNEPATTGDLSRRLEISSDDLIDHIQALWHADLLSTRSDGIYRVAADLEGPLRAVRLYILRRTESKI